MNLTTSDRYHLQGVHPDLVHVFERAARMSNSGFRVIDGVRTIAEQRANMKRGVSQTMDSRHIPAANGLSHAVDVVPLVDGAISWDWQYYSPLAVIIKQAAALEGVPIEWGGDWKSFKDGPHWQLPRLTYPGTGPHTIVAPAIALDARFERAVKILLRHEGGYVNHAADDGGPTNMGVTLATFRQYVKPAGTIEDLKNLTVDQARAVYRQQYWSACRCEELPDGLAYATFDFAVHSGTDRAIRTLQRAIGAEGGPDGVFGSKTLAAAKAANPGMAIKALCDLRLAYLQEHADWPVFGKGWTVRVNDVRDQALAFAAVEAESEPPAVAAPPTVAKPAPRIADGGFNASECLQLIEAAVARLRFLERI